MIQSFLKNMDPEQAAGLLESLDRSVIDKALRTGIEQQVVPHFDDVRVAANEEYEDPSDVREKYESMSDEDQEQTFHEAAADLMAVLTQMREDPVAGGLALKNRLRDPWMVEALLLVFDHENVPAETVAEQKDFAATWIKWVGINVIPEVYTSEEARDVVEMIYPEGQFDEVWEQFDYEIQEDE